MSSWVESFLGHTLAFTGKVYVDGDWVFREDCVRMAEVRGATGWKSDMSRKVTLLVYGDLASARVTDQTRQYSKKLKLAAELQAAGHQLTVIDGEGFADLVSGFPARSRQLRAASVDDMLVLPQPGEGILGGPLALRQTPQLPVDALATDLKALERGSAAHEATLQAFASSLTNRGLQPEQPGRKAPPFDVGWVDQQVVYVAEVKSLGSAIESQQVRLGLGQVLDYAHTLRAELRDQVVQPVVVLERMPVELERWRGALASASVLLAWGPNFEFH